MATRTETTVISEEEIREAIALWYRHKYGVQNQGKLSIVIQTREYSEEENTEYYATVVRPLEEPLPKE